MNNLFNKVIDQPFYPFVIEKGQYGPEHGFLHITANTALIYLRLICGDQVHFSTPSRFSSGNALRTAARSCLAVGSLPFMAAGSLDCSS